MVRDALGGVVGSSLSMFRGFSNKIQKSKIQKLKIDQKMVSLRPPGGPGRVPQDLGWLKLDEIDATNSFLMLLMDRNCLK